MDSVFGRILIWMASALLASATACSDKSEKEVPPSATCNAYLKCVSAATPDA